MLGCQRGDSVRVHSVDAGLTCCQRLAELGIMEGAELTVLKQSEPLLVVTRDSRIAIDRQTAARIEVSYAPAS
jgi:Fe2+ transport system protein FeoA